MKAVPLETKDLLCYHHSNGANCSFGSSCIFSHDPTTSIPIPSDVCLFNLRGNCCFTSDCAKIHCTALDIISSYQDAHIHNHYHQPLDNHHLNQSHQLPLHNSFSNSSSSGGNTSSNYQSFASSLPTTSYSNENNVFLNGNSNENNNNYRQSNCRNNNYGYLKSVNKTCSICLDIVLDKSTRRLRQFGLLSNCSHVFCLDCIRTWRSSSAENKRTCPECRIKSDYYVASPYFYDGKDVEKKWLLQAYLVCL